MPESLGTVGVEALSESTHITARFSLRQQQAGQVAPDPGNPAAQVASIMWWTPWIFPLGTIVGGLIFGVPVAILLYWLTNSAWTMAQQHIAYRTMSTVAAQTTASASTTPLASTDHERRDLGTPPEGARQRGRKRVNAGKRKRH